MGIIHVLDRDTINRIAAGEVIERPASVVKELVENAVDSGADKLTIETQQGGIDLIRVTDNGCGFTRDDIPTAFLRHATSKISTGDDLFHIRSLGFRGEALSSIAAVAKVELLTYNTEDYLGTRYVIEGGEEITSEDAGCPQGTTLLVRDLFYNVPVRRKFLKSATTETGYISELLERFAVAHPNVSVTYIAGSKTVFQSSGNGRLRDAVLAVYGREIASELIPVEYSDEHVIVSGMIAKPAAVRNNRSMELCFVNGRDIRSKLIGTAIEDAYQSYVMQHKYPCTALMLTVPEEEVDVNVHPTKIDVRFQNREAVYNGVVTAIRSALRKALLIRNIEETAEPSKPESGKQPRPAESFEVNRSSMERYIPSGALTPAAQITNPAILQNPEASAPASIDPVSDHIAESSIPSDTTANMIGNFENTVTDNATEYAAVSAGSQPYNTSESDVPATHLSENERPYEAANIPDVTELIRRPAETPAAEETARKEEVIGEQLSFMEKDPVREYRLVGQVFDTYWIIELDNQLLMIDQHAAHEKINYERFLRQIAQGSIDTQMMSPPEIISLTIREEEALLTNMEYLEKAGFEISSYGGREYAINGVPTVLFGLSPKDYLLDTLNQLTDVPKTDPLLRVLEKLASMSCKAAIKGNQHISLQEAKHLVDELLTLDNPYHCPHGRPVILSFSKYEIEKMFKRIV